MIRTSLTLINWRVGLLLSFIAGSLFWLFTLDPIPQNPAYHAFADSGSWFGIPNTWNVISNVPFLIAGFWGVHMVLSLKDQRSYTGWLVLFVGICFVSFGSAYYHLNPSNDSLVWDRLPMTVGFMGLFVALTGEYVGQKWIRILLVPAIVIGASSVLVWHLTDDLRFYAWVQGMPLGVVAIYLLVFKSAYSHTWTLAIALSAYILAKVVESYDVEVFDMIALSGHSLKHLLAATGCFLLVSYIQHRRPRQNA